MLSSVKHPLLHRYAGLQGILNNDAFITKMFRVDLDERMMIVCMVNLKGLQRNWLLTV
jgi:hypothetical protein